MVKIGILNLQGAVSEHFDMTRKTVENLKLDIEVEEVRYSDDVEKCDGLIISGGESTVIGKLIKERGIDKVIKEDVWAEFVVGDWEGCDTMFIEHLLTNPNYYP